MKSRQNISRSLLAAMLLLTGCASGMAQGPGAANRDVNPSLVPSLVSQDQARHLTAQYRRQAADLRDLAQRTEWEARWYESQFGVSDQEASRRRAQARDLWAAADEADQLALEYRRQVPHGQIQ
ncbi:MAG: hypothetical protein GDA67_13825 [Nitrospira sp. CR1.3]|nr:hypothetical protein [Nitrospira sp. CR1.3]